MIFFSFFFISLVTILGFVSLTLASEYHEQLVLQPLPPSSLLASFNFRSNATLSSFNQQNFRYFPRSLAQILEHSKTQELHLRFSTGRWDADRWGARPWNGTKEGGSGVELWAWIEEESETSAFNKWITLTNSLSGLFCASLNFIDSTRTSRPAISFDPIGDNIRSNSTLHLLHGTLPGEVVCTENLTPFLKLLPCKGKVGISSLLDGHKLFDTSWQTMSIDVRPRCPHDLDECIVEIEQTIDMVLDIDRSKRPRDNPIPRPGPAEDLNCDQSKPYSSSDTCFPTDSTAEKSWSLAEIFGRSVRGICPLTDQTGDESGSVCINIPSQSKVSTSGAATEYQRQTGDSRCYALSDSDFDIGVTSSPSEVQNSLNPPLLHAERSITGHGQERGGIRTILTNPSTTQPLDFVYFETLPWFMRPYIHTLQATLSDISESKSSGNLIQETFYRPAVDRHRGTQLELLMSIPPNSTITLTYDFEKAILRYTEYPPDANRGFNVAPAVIRLLPNRHSPDKKDSSIYLRTTSLLLPLPTPDFSMPYNVIILTSTVMALAFGNIFNLLVRRFVGADEVEGFNLRSVKGKIMGRLITLRDKLAGKARKVE